MHGGINVVTITALSVGVNTTLVVAVQTVRLIATLLLGPPHRRSGRHAAGKGGGPCLTSTDAVCHNLGAQH